MVPQFAIVFSTPSGVPSDHSAADVRSIGVSTEPGAIELTRTPYAASSTAIARQSALSAPLLAV